MKATRASDEARVALLSSLLLENDDDGGKRVSVYQG
jgi:hypothetical protein